MRKQFISLAFLSILLCGCDGVQPDSSAYVDNPMCLQIKQKLTGSFPSGGGGNNQNDAFPLSRVTEADRARLLKEYNYYGCVAHSDGRYAYPDESLKMNEKANQLKDHEIPTAEKDSN